MFWDDVEQKNVSMAIALHLIYGISYPQTSNRRWGRISLTQKIYPPQRRVLGEILLNGSG
jgi:hypothetical protein